MRNVVKSLVISQLFDQARFDAMTPSQKRCYFFLLGYAGFLVIYYSFATALDHPRQP
jgi:hypothetical protein